MQLSNFVEFDKKIREKNVIMDFIQGHRKPLGREAGVIKNPMWKIIENGQERLLMFCEKNTICKLCPESWENTIVRSVADIDPIKSGVLLSQQLLPKPPVAPSQENYHSILLNTPSRLQISMSPRPSRQSRQDNFQDLLLDHKELTFVEHTKRFQEQNQKFQDASEASRQNRAKRNSSEIKTGMSSVNKSLINRPKEPI
jgi:hypothetical protein